MTKTFCDRCHADIQDSNDLRHTSDYEHVMRYLGTKVKKAAKEPGSFDLCTDCMFKMMDLVEKFLKGETRTW